MSNDPITRLRRLYEQATPGEWEANDEDIYSGVVQVADTWGGSRETFRHDARLIAAGHNLLPYLLDYVKALEIENELLGEYASCDWSSDDDVPPEILEAEQDADNAGKAWRTAIAAALGEEE